MEVGVRYPVLQRFGPGLGGPRLGRILNVASVAGRIGRAGDGHYGPAKAYVIALSEALQSFTLISIGWVMLRNSNTSA